MKAPVYCCEVMVRAAGGETILLARIELPDRAALREAKGYARAAGLGLDEFFVQVFGRRQEVFSIEPPRPNVRQALRAEHVSFACSDPALTARIERAAVAFGQTFLEYVADAVAAAVEGDEDNLLILRRTGEPMALLGKHAPVEEAAVA